jgi:hypothetical protein
MIRVHKQSGITQIAEFVAITWGKKKTNWNQKKKKHTKERSEKCENMYSLVVSDE